MALIVKVLKRLLLVIGLLASFLLVLAFTDLPYFAYHALSLNHQQLSGKADVIVVMGGDGMPSPDGLLRLYYGSEAAKENPNATVVIALPKNEDGSLTQLELMADELELKGIGRNRIVFEPNGFNTRSQAQEIRQLFEAETKLLIVSSPEHLYRAIRSFEKVGFTEVGSLPTFEKPSDEENLKDKTDKKDKRVRNLSLRYNLWSYLQYEIRVLREYCAIAYYWVKGWI
jgi:uncharacterized SAM-binding protein YcdF (DUF218 family)